MNESIGPTLDYLVAAQGDRAFTFVRTIKNVAIDGASLIVNLYHSGVGRNGTIALFDHFILHTAWQYLDAFLLFVVGKEILTLFLVGAILFLHSLRLESLHLGASHHVGLVESHDATLASCAADETSHEILERDGLGGVIAKDLMVDALYHLLANLLTYLDASKIGCLSLVVAQVGTLVETLDKVVNICGVNTHALLEILLEALSLSHTESITHRVNIIF